MSRYGDSKKAGSSKLVPYKHGEEPGERHARRLATNEKRLDEVREWCASEGVRLTVHNDGHHWIFAKAGHTVEWWPSSAKLIVDKQWGGGTHVHDHLQAIKIIREKLL